MPGNCLLEADTRLVDGGDPLKATLGRPHGVAVDKDGAIYIGDTLSHRIRVVK